VNAKSASTPQARAVAITAAGWVVAFTLGFASCGVVTLHSSWGDRVWPGPLLGGLLSQALATAFVRRGATTTTAALGVPALRNHAESLLRFILMVVLWAGANFALGCVVLAWTFRD